MTDTLFVYFEGALLTPVCNCIIGLRGTKDSGIGALIRGKNGGDTLKTPLP